MSLLLLLKEKSVVLALSLVSQTPTTLTLGWTPPQGVTAYRFSSEKQLKATNTNDPSRTDVKFAKGSAWYKVEALSVLAEGTYSP